jgi:hypothetical protein
MQQIPLWVVASLGKEVALTVPFVGPCETYPVGSVGILTSIQWNENGGGFYATVAIDHDDPSYLENFSFNQVRPIRSRVGFSLNIEEGVIAF